MGGGNHKCCDTTINHAAPRAAIIHNAVPHATALGIVADASVYVPQLEPLNQVACFLVATSSSPPGFATVLRI